MGPGSSTADAADHLLGETSGDWPTKPASYAVFSELRLAPARGSYVPTLVNATLRRA